MKEQQNMGLIGGVVAGVVLAPIAIGVVINLGIMSVEGIAKLHRNIKIKKGLKKGTIVEIDGMYYEVQEVDKED